MKVWLLEFLTLNAAALITVAGPSSAFTRFLHAAVADPIHTVKATRIVLRLVAPFDGLLLVSDGKNAGMTEDWPTRVRRLEEEVAGLRRAMRTRGLIEQAKGMIAERIGCDPEAAFDILAKRSQRTNVPLVSIAADVVAANPAQLPASPRPANEQLDAMQNSVNPADMTELRPTDSETQPDLRVIVSDDTVASSADIDWIRAVLDVVHGQAHLLTAIRGAAGQVVDFQVEAMSQQTAQTESATLGRRLLDCYPHLANNGVFNAYQDVLNSGEVWSRAGSEEEFAISSSQPHRLVLERRAGRIAGAVLASWERVDEIAAKERHLSRLEAFGGFGWATYDLNTSDAQWSPGMYRLTQRDSGRAPLALDALPELVEPTDRPRMHTFLADAQSGLDAVLEARLSTEGRPAWLRLICEAPPPDAIGKTVNLLVQDVSERYAREERLRMLQSRAAEGRLRLASARELTSRLIELLYPPERIALAAPGARIVGNHPVRNGDQPLRADFSQAIALPDGTFLLMVGDVFDVGLPAAATAMRILTPAATLATAGLGLRAVLEALNTDLRHTGELSLASLLLGRWSPSTLELSWSAAGHLPPVLLGKEGAELLTNPTGPLLGLVDSPQYAEYQTTLAAGDAVVFYTDGMLRPGVADPLAPLMVMLEDAYRDGGAEAITQLPLPDGADEACVLVLEAYRGG